MKKAAIYVRLSEEDRTRPAGTSSESIQNQKSLLIQYAVEHHYEVYKVYSDEDYSGIDKERPAFRQLLQDAEAHRFNIILVKTQSRFTRDMEQAEAFLNRRLPEWGIRLVSLVDGTDTDDDKNHKARQLNGLINEWYLEDLSANVRASLEIKRNQGKYLSSFALYGYLKDPENHNHIIKNPETAPVVQRIFSLYLAGFGTSQIAMVLNAEGVLSPSAYKQSHDVRYKAPVQAQWTNSTVRLILHNPIYTGDMVQGRYQKVSYKSTATKRLPKEKWKVVPDTHEPLVDHKSFERIQELMTQRCSQPDPRPVWRPLAKKVKCGCGGGMMLSGSKDSWHMRCQRNSRDPRLCTPNRIPVPDLEAIVLDKLQQHLAELLDIDRLALFVQQGDKTSAKMRQTLHQTKHELTNLEQKIKALYLKRADGTLTIEEFNLQTKKLLQQKQLLEGKASQLSQKSALPDFEKTKQRLLPYLFADCLTKDMTDALIDHVTVWPLETNGDAGKTRKIEITWKY